MQEVPLRRNHWSTLGAYVAVLICLASAARAEKPAGAREPEAARALFHAGLEHSRAARWSEAVEAFGRSAALVERPSTLQNLAVALEREGRFGAALKAIERHSEIADPVRHRSAREALARLALKLSERMATLERVPDPPAPEPTVEPRSPRPSPPRLSAQRPPHAPQRSEQKSPTRKRTGWAAVGLGLCTALAGGGLWISTERDAREWEKDLCSGEACVQKYQRLTGSIDRRDRSGTALMVVSGLSMATGVTLLLLGDRREQRRARISLRPNGLSAHLRF